VTELRHLLAGILLLVAGTAAAATGVLAMAFGHVNGASIFAVVAGWAALIAGSLTAYGARFRERG
jgi:hypothetical protein